MLAMPFDGASPFIESAKSEEKLFYDFGHIKVILIRIKFKRKNYI